MNSDFVGFNELLYRVNRAGSGEVDRNFCIERNSSYPYCVFHYVVKGSGEIIHRGKNYCVKERQCFVLNAFEGHSYWTNPNDPFIFNWIEFNGGDSTKIIGNFLNFNLPVINEPQSSIINKYILRIFTYLRSSIKNGEIYISKTIYNLLMRLLFDCKNESFCNLPESKIRDVQKVMNYITSNLHESLSTDSLAKIINYNPQYFCRIFKEFTGVTPSKYVLDRRVSRAKELLGTGDVQIDLLAEQLGFCNASHFIRKFKKAEGLTPAEFRKESLSYYKKL